jgi:superoxide dismutase, Fe-Mn family
MLTYKLIGPFKGKIIMKKFEETKFNLGPLKGLSAKNIEEHLKLYAGYVKNANLIIDKIEEYKKDREKNAYAISELERRFSFEFNGMRNHEYFFTSFVNGPRPLPEGSLFKAELEKNGMDFDRWLMDFKTLALTRGIGWAVMYYDKQTSQFVHAWVDEQHIGQLNGLSWILGIDMWEHAYLFDYIPADKKKYIEAFFDNLNWEVVEENFKRNS